MGVRSRSRKSSKAVAKAKATEEVEEKQEAEASPKFLWQKVFDQDADLAAEDALKAAHWIRQMLGICLGLIFGVFQLTGFPAVLTFLTVSFMGPSFLLSTIRELDIEEINKVNPIHMEGLVPATALFVLNWIISYTVFLPTR